MGVGKRWVQSGWALSEPPADQHRGGHEARVATSAHPREPESSTGVAPTSSFRLGGPATPGLAAIPRNEWGWGEALAELGLRIRVPEETQQRGSRLTGLSSVVITGNTR